MKAMEHPGTVIGIKGTVVDVRTGIGIVQVPASERDLQVGQAVIVLAEPRVSALAVKLSYVLPLVLFVATFFALRRATGNEGLSWLLAIFTLIPYYTILLIITNRVLRAFRFRLKNDP